MIFDLILLTALSTTIQFKEFFFTFLLFIIYTQSISLQQKFIYNFIQKVVFATFQRPPVK